MRDGLPDFAVIEKTPRRPRGRLYLAVCGAVLLAATLGFTYSGSKKTTYPNPVPLRVSGLVGNSSGAIHPIPPEEASGARYLAQSNVLQSNVLQSNVLQSNVLQSNVLQSNVLQSNVLQSNVLQTREGDLKFVPENGTSPVTVLEGDPRIEESIRESRRWLADGDIPGDTELKREVAVRSLLNLRLLSSPDGATIAAPTERWDYVWPRDASFVSAAFSATGHHEESLTGLRFLARVQDEEGRWEARYHPDGDAVLDGRGAQLDGNGWFLWAVWFHARTSPDGVESVSELWPQTKFAADATARSLGRDGLPPGGADYWEIRTLRPNLGTSAALLVGLRSAADLASDLGHEDDASRYREAADRLDEAIRREFAPNGYTRTPWPGSGRDTAVTFLGPPFASENPNLRREIDATYSTLRVPNGGVIPGEKWPQEPTVSWTPETALFMLSASAGGDEDSAAERFGWLAAHRTELGAFPEKVDTDGSLKAAAPLAWTSSIVLLALAFEDETLPIPPK